MTGSIDYWPTSLLRVNNGADIRYGIREGGWRMARMGDQALVARGII